MDFFLFKAQNKSKFTNLTFVRRKIFFKVQATVFLNDFFSVIFRAGCGRPWMILTYLFLRGFEYWTITLIVHCFFVHPTVFFSLRLLIKSPFPIECDQYFDWLARWSLFKHIRWPNFIFLFSGKIIIDF